ncbi:MAG: SDR family oxidoreductase [Acidimicrobiales bacterium]|nr:MAG: SDR family oxidoreductase [Acidimicrobiales bacterium]
MNLDNRLAGTVTLVTGGGSGIGRGACERIAAEGGAVTVADIRPALAEEVASAIRAEGGQALAVTCDVANEDEVAAAVATTVAEFGSLSGLVANAGTTGVGWVHETAIEDWHFVLGVNLTGPFLCCKHALPHMMQARRGSIVMTSSIAGSVAGAGGSAASYSVSKAGVIALARQIAVDYGDYGIRANAIQPGAVEGSNLGAHALEDREKQVNPGTERMKRPKPWIPLRRLGHFRDDYGATIAFLLSDDAGFITGAQIPVDGGYLST